jgi:hypothetical protein
LVTDKKPEHAPDMADAAADLLVADPTHPALDPDEQQDGVN